MSTYSADVLATSGLVSYWRLGEPSGTSAADSKGSNTGTYTGGFTLAAAGALAGDTDTAVSLNGSTGFVTVPSNASLHPAQITLEAWVYPTTLNAGAGIVLTNQFSAKVGLELGLDVSGGAATTLTAGSYDGSWHVATDPGSALALNTWSHVVATWDGTNVTLYKNGAVAAQTAFPGPLQYDANPFFIGRRHDASGSPFWLGRIDDVAVYNVALSTATVLDHYRAGTLTGSYAPPPPSTAKPPLALSAVAIAADGSETTWWSGDKYAYNRPQSLTFSTRIGEGFSDESCTLARRVDADYNDLELYNDIVLVGDDGQIAYEGRIGATPRSTSGGHSIAVQCAGHMAHAKDQKFREVYVDRDTGAWGTPPLARRVALGLASIAFDEFPWNQDGQALVAAPGTVKAQSTSETWYVPPPDVPVTGFQYIGSDTTVPGTWLASRFFATDVTDASSTDAYATTLDGALHRQVMTTPRTYLVTDLYTNGNGLTAVPAAGTNRRITAVAVYGGHTLASVAIDASTPDGFYASQVITDIAQRFCPKLSTAGVQATSLVIPHIVFRDRTTPFDAFLLLNGPHGYELAVWENKTLYFRPYDLSDYDWQVRIDQPGVDTSLQGDTTEGLANYAVVEFDNVATGLRDQVTPADDSSLVDTTVDHPANKHGYDVELTVGLTFPTTSSVAIAFGQSYLNEFNRPKNKGQITVQGHILDRAGHWTQPWMVRAGQTISVTNHPNDSPRLITETSYDHSTHTVTISTDSGELNMVEAVVDYIRTSLTAGNLA